MTKQLKEKIYKKPTFDYNLPFFCVDIRSQKERKNIISIFNATWCNRVCCPNYYTIHWNVCFPNKQDAIIYFFLKKRLLQSTIVLQ